MYPPTGGSTIVRAEVSALRWQTGSKSSGFFEVPASKGGGVGTRFGG